MFGECHAHLFMDGVNYRQAVLDHRDGVNEEKLREHLAAYQAAGISFVRDGGDRYGVSERARELAGEYGITYQSPLFAIHWKGHYGGIVGRAAENLKEYRELVKEVRRKKGDFIKIMASGIMEYTEFGKLSEPALEPERIREMIHIAHEEGFSVMVHANGREAVLPAVLAGADSIEHGNYIDRECLVAMAQTGCVWVPTIVTTANLIGCGRYPDVILRHIYQREREQLLLGTDLGVCLAAGSDAGAYLVPHGQGLVREVEIFREVLEGTGSQTGTEEAERPERARKCTEQEVTALLETGEKKIRERFHI